MITHFFSFIAGKYFLWFLIALLALSPVLQLFNYPFSAREFKELMHTSGESAIRLMILAMLVSPLRLVFPKSRIVQWMARHRRYFGVGAFCLALTHVTAYILEHQIAGIIEEISQPRIIAGWIAFIIFVPLAVTSANWAVKKLGGIRWKNLHRLVYVSAIATALHWLLLKDGEGIGPAAAHFTPLLLLEIYRGVRYLRQKRALTA